MAASDDHVSLDRLRERLPSDPSVLKDFAAAMQYGLLAGGATREFVTEAAKVLHRAMLDQEDLEAASGLLLNFTRYGDQAIKRASTVDVEMNWSGLRKLVAEVVGSPLAALFAHRSRIRIWAVNPEQKAYVGLMCLGMGSDFRQEFELGKLLPTDEPPYEVLQDSSCFLLKAETVRNTLARKRGTATAATRWYEDKLGLGIVVPETYTWHFSGPTAVASVPSRSADGTVWAISFDLGAQSKCDPVTLRLLDRFLLALAPYLSSALDTVASKLTEAAVEPTRPSSHPRAPSDEGRDSTRVPAAPHVPDANGSLQTFFEAQLACIPSTWAVEGEEPLPYVYSPGDSSAEHVRDWVATLRSKVGPGVALAVGLSGTGKSTILETLVGVGRRPGPVEPFKIGTDERQAEMTFLGAAKEYYYNKERRVSIVENAGEGVVLMDEFLSRLRQAPLLDILKESVERVRQGKHLQELGTGRWWKPRALLVFTGPPRDYDAINENQDLDHWIRRLEPIVELPSWTGLSSRSRAVIVRWGVIREMAKRGFRRGSIQADAFHWLVERPEPATFFSKTNTDGVLQIIRKAGELSAVEDGEFRLSSEHIADAIRDRRITLPARNAVASDQWLRLGKDSSWETNLDDFHRLIVTLAECDAQHSAATPCVSRDELARAVGGVKSQGAAFDAAYLLYAAVRNRTPGADPHRTAPGRYTSHFENKAPWMNMVAERLGGLDGQRITPADLRIRGQTKGRLGDAFEQHVLLNAGRLQTIVERVACACPTFFHIVPYWNWPHLLGTFGSGSDYEAEITNAGGATAGGKHEGSG